LASALQANPLWPVETRFPILDKEVRVDVAIVGGGIAGVSCGFHLHNSGYKVAVIEKEEVGSAATGASSGILYYGSGGNFVEAVQRYGRAEAATLWKETERTIADIVSLIEKQGINCGFRRTGGIMVAKNDAEETRIEKEKTELTTIGITTKRYSSQDLQTFFKGRDFLSGLSFSACSVIHPAQFAAELAKKFAVPVYEKSPMLKLTEEEERVTIESSRAKIQCDRVILATNLEPLYGLEKHFAQETTVVLASQELPNIKEVWPEDKVIWTMEERYDILYSLGNRLGLELYEPKNVKQKIANYYGKVAFERRYQWGESWSKTMDMLPIVGPVTDRVYAAVAMGDEGIVMGFTVGKKIALLLKQESDQLLRMMSPRRFTSQDSP
jgi:glycine/D-amino acid oxidase-like deaminating enzyme